MGLPRRFKIASVDDVIVRGSGRSHSSAIATASSCLLERENNVEKYAKDERDERHGGKGQGREYVHRGHSIHNLSDRYRAITQANVTQGETLPVTR